MTSTPLVSQEHAPQAYGAWARPQRRGDLIEHELDGEALIFDPRSLDTHRLNETALCVWRQWDGTRDLVVVASMLAQTYDVDEEKALGHVTRLYAELDSLGLLEEEAHPHDGAQS